MQKEEEPAGLLEHLPAEALLAEHEVVLLPVPDVVLHRTRRKRVRRRVRKVQHDGIQRKRPSTSTHTLSFSRFMSARGFSEFLTTKRENLQEQGVTGCPVQPPVQDGGITGKFLRN